MTLDDEDSFSRTAYRIKRIALNVSVWFAVISGFTLLVFPVMDIAVPETGLLRGFIQ